MREKISPQEWDAIVLIDALAEWIVKVEFHTEKTLSLIIQDLESRLNSTTEFNDEEEYIFVKSVIEFLKKLQEK